MKSFFKRSAISVIVLGMATSVHAAHAVVAPYNPSNWCPQFSGVFLGAEGLNLRPQNGDLDYVTVFPEDFPFGTDGGSFHTKSISTSYDWSWRVYGGIKFTENDDLTLSWMQLRTSDDDSVSPTGTFDGGAGLSNARFIGTAPWLNVNGHVTFDLDDAYAVWGHTVNFNNPWSVRFAGGVEYAKLRSNLTVVSDISNFDPELGTIGFEAFNRTRGVGPRAEFDMTYRLPYGFALYGKTNAALLVSTRDISLSPTNDLQEDFSFEFSDRHVVIPKVGMRLGASYTYVWGQAGSEGPCTLTSLTIDAGWQAESYIHAIERPDTSISGPVGVAQQGSVLASTKVSNFSDQGFYVGVKLGMDWM